MNVELTLVWKRLSLSSPEQIDDAFQSFTDRLRSFLDHRGLKSCYYAVFEYSSRSGLHTHIGLSIPHRYRKDFKCWLSSQNGVTRRDPNNETPFYRKHNTDNHWIGQWNWFKYCMKSVNPALLPAEKQQRGDITFHEMALLGHKPYFSGEISIPRLRLPRCLGTKAQLVAGYAPPSDITYNDVEFTRGIYDRALASLGNTEVIL